MEATRRVKENNIMKEQQYLFYRKALPYFVKLDVAKNMIAFCNRDYESLIANSYNPEHNTNDPFKDDVWYYCDKKIIEELAEFLAALSHSFSQREESIFVAYLYYDANAPWNGILEKNNYLKLIARVGEIIYSGEFTKQLGALVYKGFPFYFNKQESSIQLTPSNL